MAPHKIFDFFKSNPAQKELTCPKAITKAYSYWRTRVCYSIYGGYTLFYFTRKSFTFAMPSMIEDLGYTLAQVGFLGTLLYLTYGVSKFVGGVISDRSNPRLFMSFALFMTGFCNLCFGLSSSLVFFALFWGINGRTFYQRIQRCRLVFR